MAMLVRDWWRVGDDMPVIADNIHPFVSCFTGGRQADGAFAERRGQLVMP
jgi:hypothetical protein